MATPQAQFTIDKRKGQNKYYEEALGDSLTLRMMQIPAGTFEMGSLKDEPERFDREGPQHTVNISTFFMGKYPVTQAQWSFVGNLPKVNRELERDPSRFKGENRPVERVSWFDAVEFCDRLDLHTGRAYRLPTEAEWEYACRAGTTTPFHFGMSITTNLANYRGTDDESLGWSGSYGEGPQGEYRKQTTPVDYFDHANTFGLCDMHGNVWEWCQDHWHENYNGAPKDGSAWLLDNAEENASRIIRGGSWVFNPRGCRSAYRYSYDPREASYDIGFRVVCSEPRALQ